MSAIGNIPSGGGGGGSAALYKHSISMEINGEVEGVYFLFAFYNSESSQYSTAGMKTLINNKPDILTYTNCCIYNENNDHSVGGTISSAYVSSNKLYVEVRIDQDETRSYQLSFMQEDLVTRVL